LPGTLPVFAEEFGLEYAYALVRKSLEEMDRLLAVITVKKPKPAPHDIGAAAHDLKSISGYIGLKRIQEAADAVEKCALKPAVHGTKTAQQRELSHLINELANPYAKDVPVMRKIVPAEGESRVKA